MFSHAIKTDGLVFSGPKPPKVSFIVAIAVATIACYLNAYHFPPIIPYIVFVLGIVTILVDDILGMKVYLLSLLIFDDFPKFFSEAVASDFHTIYNMKVAGNTMFMIWTSLLFGKLILRESLVRQFSVNNFLFPREVKAILWVFVIAAVWGLQNLLSSPKYYINDFSFLVNTLVGLYAAYVLVKSEQDLKRYFWLFLIISFFKYSIVLIDGIGMSSHFAMYTLKAESGSYLSIIPLSFFIIYTYRTKPSISFNRKTYFFLLSCSALTIAYNVVTASRGRFILLAMAFVLAFIVTKKYRILVLASIAVFCVLGAIYSLNPKFVQYAAWKLSTVRPGSEESASSTVRAIEYSNIVGQQIDQPYLLPFGTGYGGFFTSKYKPFTFTLDEDAYPMDWIVKDQFYKPHSTVLFSLLKSGVVGIFVFYGALISISRKSLKAAMKRYDPGSDIVITLSLAMPLLFIINFTPKTQVFSGFVLGILITRRLIQGRNENGHYIDGI